MIIIVESYETNCRKLLFKTETDFLLLQKLWNWLLLKAKNDFYYCKNYEADCGKLSFKIETDLLLLHKIMKLIAGNYYLKLELIFIVAKNYCRKFFLQN